MENHTPNCLYAPLLTTEEYLHNLHLLAAHGFQTISFTGGEPLLNPQFAQILNGSREIYKTVEITTNGSKLLDNIDAVIKYVDVLKISIDAIDPELSVSIARNPKAAETVHIIEECCKAGIKTIGLNFVYMKQNEKELPRLVDFAAKLKQSYNTDIYISILDLYFSNGNREF
jgi:molybdenum cofactor biosynthesis enzyme MoaA